MGDKKKIPDLVVWDEDKGYNASKMQYPTNVSAPAFTLPDVGLVRTESAKKMMDVFEQEKKELVGKVEKMYREYLDSVMVWESKISLYHLIEQTYYFYDFKSVNKL